MASDVFYLRVQLVTIVGGIVDRDIGPLANSVRDVLLELARSMVERVEPPR